MKVMIDTLLEEKGKTRYWLSKEAKVKYQNLCRLADGVSLRADFAVIERICNTLNCEVGDILKMK
jgi:putative transcriptional regulator